MLQSQKTIPENAVPVSTTNEKKPGSQQIVCNACTYCS